MTALLTSRLGLAGIVAMVAALIMAGLLVSRAGLQADLADAEGRVAALSADIALQNAAARKLQADSAAAKAASDARAAAALKPRPKPSTATLEDLNRWISAP